MYTFLVSRRWLVIAVAGLLLVACDGATTTDSTASDRDAASSREALSDTALQAVGPQDQPGCAAAVGRKGQVVWSGARGVADLDTGRPITTDTVFDIASASKQFTATAVLLLAGQGRLSLDDKVAEHLTRLPDWAQRISIGQLMHHTSGIPDYIELLLAAGYDLPDKTTQAQAVQALTTVRKLGFVPGSRYEYSNSNYLLLAEVVAVVSGQPLPDFLTDHVFEPLNLDMVMDPVGAIPGKATPYAVSADGALVAGGSRWAQVGDGAIQTTPIELVRWADNYRTGRVGGNDVLDAQFEGAAEVPPAEAGGRNGARYGAGIIQLTDGTLLHYGQWDGFVSWFEVLGDRRTAVAVTCNTDRRRGDVLAESLAHIWR